MRIFSGKHRGKKLVTSDDKNLRPTTGMAREAIFNILTHGEYTNLLPNAVVADLFCGSGALGLEALSRGAVQAVFIDHSQENLNLARTNADHLGELANCTFIRCDSSTPPAARFACDVIFMDAPYGSGLATPALQNLAKQGWLKDGTIVMVEIGKKETLPVPEGFTLCDKRQYGKAQITLLEWSGASSQPALG